MMRQLLAEGLMCKNPKLEILFVLSCSNLPIWKAKWYWTLLPCITELKVYNQPQNTWLSCVVEEKVNHHLNLKSGRSVQDKTIRSLNLGQRHICPSANNRLIYICRMNSWVWQPGVQGIQTPNVCTKLRGSQPRENIKGNRRTLLYETLTLQTSWTTC